MTFLLKLAAFLILDALWWRLADRRLRPLRRTGLWRVLLGAFMVVQISFVLAMVMLWLIEDAPDFGPVTWKATSYIWHLLVLPTALSCVLAIKAMRRLTQWIKRAKPAELAVASPDSQEHPTRREMLAAAAMVLPPLATAGLTFRALNTLGDFRIRRQEVSIPGLPADLDGLAIIHLTDLHIGRFLPPGMAQRVADAANALSADLVVFTGDLCDGSATEIRPAIEFLRRLNPRHGLAVVEGNHDCMKHAGWFEKPMQDAGLPLLLDQTKLCRIPGRTTPVQFLGIAWGELLAGSQMGKWGKARLRQFREPGEQATARSLQLLLSQKQPEAFPILLSHHPHLLDNAAAAGLPLVLAGHTHGGQIMLTDHIGGGPIRFRYWSGIYQKGNCRLVISNGLGSWFPLRVNAPAEIGHMILRRDR